MNSTTEPTPLVSDQSRADAEAMEGAGEQSSPAAPESLMARSKRYHRWRMTLTASECVAELTLLAVLLLSGGSLALRQMAGNLSGNPWMIVAFYLLPVGVVFSVVSVAFGAVRTFFVERRFGISKESFGGWLTDEIKGLVLGGVLSAAALETFYGLLRHFPNSWGG